MIGIYKITSPSGRVYIGQSVNIAYRFNYYKGGHCKSQKKLYRSFIKYGVENHSFEIICECDKSELNDKERYYQILYKCVTHGLNCDLSNDSNCPKERSEETKKKISLYQTGIVRSSITRSNMSEARKGLKFSDSHKENIRKSKQGQNNKRSKLIIDLATGVYYESIAEAGICHNIDSRTLSRYLNGTRRNKTMLKAI